MDQTKYKIIVNNFIVTFQSLLTFGGHKQIECRVCQTHTHRITICQKQIRKQNHTQRYMSHKQVNCKMAIPETPRCADYYVLCSFVVWSSPIKFVDK